MPNGAARPAPVRQDAEAGGADMHASRHDAAREPHEDTPPRREGARLHRAPTVAGGWPRWGRSPFGCTRVW